jgi:hypothetical protein
MQMQKPVSQIVAFSLNPADRLVGTPLMALYTYLGTPGNTEALFVVYGDRYAPVTIPVTTPAEVLKYTRRLRRLAQDQPQDFVTVNITGGTTLLVA